MSCHSLASLSSDPNVVARQVEFLGGDSLDDATCKFLVASGSSPRDATPLLDPAALRRVEPGWEIFRSLWDRAALLVDLDVEYVNFDLPAEAYLHPERVFALQQPVETEIEDFFGDFGIVPLHLVSGRGHHYLFRVRRDAPAFLQLADLGRVPPGLAALDALAHPPAGEKVDLDLSRAYHGLGLVIEFAAQRIQQRCAPRCELPVEITDAAAGPRQVWREIVSLDLSEYADPLGRRSVRVPFSPYLKPLQQRAQLGESLMDGVPALISIPKGDLETLEAVRLLRNLDGAARLAGQASCRIPDASQEIEGLILAYRASPLAQFHTWFYSQEPAAAELWDGLPGESLPPCVRTILSQPTNLLLNPSGLQRVTRVLLAFGWHPRQIAGLVRSRFESAGGWGAAGNGSDPGHRADCYVRLFAGAFLAGGDELVSFNCRSAQEAERCFHQDCSYNLLDFRQSLLERRSHGRLGRWPFNRLFLPVSLS